MIRAIATATEMQNNFGKYLSIVMAGDEVIVTKNAAVSYLTDSLTGILKGNDDISRAKEERLKAKQSHLHQKSFWRGYN